MPRTVDRRLIEQAPESIESLFRLLTDGLDWPMSAELDPEDALVEWEPEELHLDPQAVAKLTSIRQMRPLTQGQPFGVFFLAFEGGRLPVGALRRLVDRLVRKKRPRGSGTHPVWGLDDLLFVVQANGATRMVHFVAFKESAGKQSLKVLSWGNASTDTRLDLLAGRLGELAWPADDVWTDAWRDRWRSVFTVGHREGIRSAETLATRMADVGRDVRDEVLALYEVETDDGPVRRLFADVREQLLHDLTPSKFADMYAQTMVYGLLTSRVTHPEDFSAAGVTTILKFENPFLDAVYSRFRDETGEAFDVDELGLRDLADELGKTDIDEVLADFGAADRRDDPVVHFYEEFLARYDPGQRAQLGAFYTPTPVVRFMVRQIDDLLKSRFGLPLGVADATTWGELSARNPDLVVPAGVELDSPVVSMIDPGTGTGTYLVEWIRVARENVLANAREDGVSEVVAEQEWHQSLGEVVLPQMNAFELSLASYAVAHLKISLLLPEEIRAAIRLPVYLTDTLAAPRDEERFEDLRDPVSVEGLEAERVKFDSVQTVVIGNPPYDRVTAAAVNGWLVEAGANGTSPLEDILKPATENTIFSHVASLYNLYVYFWRWALWKAFQQTGGPGVISFITASSWLTGPGFLGLRQLVRQLADEIWVVDIGGDNRGAHPEENVFDIETPVAIVSVVSTGASTAIEPAVAHYLRIRGTRAEKLEELERLMANPTLVEWLDAPSDWQAPLAPPTGDEDWLAYPALVDLFPWQQPGCKFGRTWPIAPDRSLLTRRWERFIASDDPDDRAKCFVTATAGRNIHTKVSDMPRLVDLPIASPHEQIVMYGYRSFDRQWAFGDPRLAKTDSPSLWASVSNTQIFMVSKTTMSLGKGPAAVSTVLVPDLDHFRGSFGGKDVFPLYRDGNETPNIAETTLEILSAIHRKADSAGDVVHVEHLFAYVYAILAGADYTTRFADSLATPGPRVPLTADPSLFGEVVAYGEELLWLHTFAERFRNETRGEHLPRDGSIEWASSVIRMPQAMSDISYNEKTSQLRVGDGVVSGVRPDVWAFEVSGMPVLRKWIGYRTKRGAGRAASSASPLDAIRPTEWLFEWSDELIDLLYVLTRTLDLQPVGVELLDRVVTGPQISANELPEVPSELRKPPAVKRTSAQIAIGST
ncbi:MAG: type ISP restriction/modification enzyme [Gaiellales bacterium]